LHVKERVTPIKLASKLGKGLNTTQGVTSMKFRFGILLVLLLALISFAALAQENPTPSPSGHEGHHAESTETAPTPSPDASPMNSGMDMMGMMDTMQQMSELLDTMMAMEMSEELHAQMQQMRDMMDTMMSGDMMSMMSSDGMTEMMDTMQQMSELLDTMMAMEMSEELHAQMQQMRDMMDMMMSGDMMGSGSETMSDMDMGGGHSMEPISSEGVLPASETLGGQPLDYELVDGVKVFTLTAEPVLWTLTDGAVATAWTYNGTVPGPMIRVTEGDRVRINFTNNLPEATTIHWHGIYVPNEMDGVAGVTQEAIQPGESFVYEFEARPAGTFMYHSHFDSDVQVGIGLYAPFIIDPAQSDSPAPDVDETLMLSEWRIVDGQTYAAMPMAGAEPNYFTINGHAFPSTETINVQVGQTVRLRLINIGQFIHPMHLHGMAFQVVAIDGYPVPEASRQTRDTISIAPGERYDIEFVATEPGTWAFHCHILHHVTNDGAEPGGLTMLINVTE
jgi:hypothetical protein